MVWSLMGALAAAVCFGWASVLQAVAARSDAPASGVDPRLLLRLAGRLPFLLGIGLDIVGFGAELAALRSLPLFVVQAVVAANLAVTAVVAAWMLDARLAAREWAAVTAVCAGLALLGLASGPEHPAAVSLTFRLALLGCAGALGAVGMAAVRLPGEVRSAALGLVAGLGFGVVAIGTRVVTSLSPLHLVRDPALYAVAVGGLLAFFFFATALQRGSVTTTTATMVVAETIVPAIVGVLALGDDPRHGFAAVAVAGFVLAVAGALALARFGEVAAEGDDAVPAPARTP